MGLESTLSEAFALHQKGNLTDAEKLYQQVLALAPDSFDARHLLGVVRGQQGRHAEALELIEGALRINPNNGQALANYAKILGAMGRWDAAIGAYDKSIAIKPSAEALNARANLLRDSGRIDEALKSYDAALAIKPQFVEALNNCGGALHAIGRLKEALSHYDKALSIRPNYPQALNNRANVLCELRRPGEALESYAKAIALNPEFVDAINNRANALWNMNRTDEARAGFNRALAINPSFPAALSNRGKMLWAVYHDYDGAVSDLEDLVRMDPDFDLARGDLLYLRMYSGDWRNFESDLAFIRDEMSKNKLVIQPFALQAVSDSASEILSCSKIFAEQEYPSKFKTITRPITRHDKIRIGYVCGEFRAHATSYLTAGLFESHDKDRFQIIAFDNGKGDGSQIRDRLEQAFGMIVDISNLSDEDAAACITREEIDILVNLNGYYGAQRMGVFARKPAPIQVNFLGFPATLGAQYIDYIVADRIVIPEPERQYYSEKVVYLPGSYQVNDSKRRVCAPTTNRKEQGLPENEFVYCNFNQGYKLTPSMFKVWMQILKRVEGSVLWLLNNETKIADNLKHEATLHGIAAERLVFAPHIPVEEHMRRLELADLFLDSLPYNGHTTASDALWAGLPLLTCRGKTFAGRVATSLLDAIGLPELSVETLDLYEETAVKLAHDRQLLNSYRNRLSANRQSCALFDTDRFRDYLEAAYTKMWEIFQRGESPRNFSVEK